MKRQLLCSAVFFSAFTFLVTPAQAQSTGTCCGKVGVGTTTISDGSGSGGQELFLDVDGAAGATHYCDENGLNCFTASSLSGGVADDSLDYTKFLDAMALDASTSITADNAEVLSITNTGTGNSFLVEDAASDTSPFVISASGLIGIGVATPTQKVDIANATDAYVKIASGGNAAAGIKFVEDTTERGTIYLDGATNLFHVSTPMAGDLILQTSGGDVGIGTTAPSSLLDLQKAGTAKANTDIFEITNSGNAADMDGTTSSVLFNQYYYDATTPAVADAAQITVGTETDWTSTASTQDSYLALSTALDGTVAEKMRVTSTGKVGIGTNAPGYSLTMTVADTTDGIDLYIPGAGAIKRTRILPTSVTLHGGSGGNNNLAITQPGSNQNATIIGTRGLDVTVTSPHFFTVSGGNVGIGTTSPTELFDINSSTMRLRTAKTPASASDTCDQGEIAWDADYVYVCVATNTWKRSGLATW